MTLDRYGHLLSDDLAGVAEALGKAIENTAVSLRYPGVTLRGRRTYPQLVSARGGSSVG